MFGSVAAFEFRYNIRSPLFVGTAALFFLIAWFDMSVIKLASEAGGTVLFNAPHALIKSHLIAAILFMFVGAAFISNTIVRDDQTGFGPIIRSTRIGKFDYLLGRFTGAFAVGALILAAVTLGAFVGTLMPFADQAMIGPNRLSGYAYGLFLFGLPNAFIISSILFALATLTRSTGGTFVGIVGLMIFYLVGQRLMEGQAQLDSLRVLVDPFGMSAYMAASRYLTAPQINAGTVPVSDMMVVSRLMWVGFALLLLLATCARFNFTERRPSRRRQRKMEREAAALAPDVRGSVGALPDPRFGARTEWAQFFARAGLEARFVFKSALFWVLLLIAFAFTLPGLLTAETLFNTPLYPLTSVFVPILDASFNTILLVIAAFYGGELVWRERERKIDQIIDSTPIPAWTLMLPKLLGLMTVMIATLAVSALVAILIQLLVGGVAIEPDKYLLWYLLPIGFDACLTAALAMFVQALSPNKYVGWGIMAIYIVLLFFGPAAGLGYPLFIYGAGPDVPLTEMVGQGHYWAAAWGFRLFWAAVALLMLVAVQALWPRGTAGRLAQRLRQAPARLTSGMRAVAMVTATAALLSGGWIVYNTRILNSFATGESTQQYLADYERRYLRYASLPQPLIKHIEIDVALYPADGRVVSRGKLQLVNATDVAIDQVHIRLADPNLKLVALDFPGTRLASNDSKFAYRIYRLDQPMARGEQRAFTFETVRERHGFRAAGEDDALAANGVELDSFDLTPRVGMHESGLIEDPRTRRAMGLPAQPPLPTLDDEQARNTQLSDNAWITADITVSTAADQTPIAPGRLVSSRVEKGRRIARFVSDAPIQNNFSIQSGRFAVKRESHAGVDYAVYYDPAHYWNVDRMMKAMKTSIAYFSDAFGPYQFDQARIIETAYRQGGHAYPNTIAIGEQASFAMDLRDPYTIDMATVFAAHELSHQWWGHQVRGTRMEGTAMLIETLAQYSALMIVKRTEGVGKIYRLLEAQQDRYLRGRRAQVGGEQPLIKVRSGDAHVAYGKGSLAMYLLQERMGEAAINRALKRFVAKYRFSTPPYPRSVDLVAMIRDEATTAEQQALITDLFERITLYDLSVEKPSAVRRADGKWAVSVPVVTRKLYADGQGNERDAPLAESIEIGLFAEHPLEPGFGKKDVIRMQRQPLRSGRQVLRFVTDRKPAFAGVDPYHLYIDRNSADNLAELP